MGNVPDLRAWQFGTTFSLHIIDDDTFLLRADRSIKKIIFEPWILTQVRIIVKSLIEVSSILAIIWIRPRLLGRRADWWIIAISVRYDTAYSYLTLNNAIINFYCFVICWRFILMLLYLNPQIRSNFLSFLQLYLISLFLEIYPFLFNITLKYSCFSVGWYHLSQVRSMNLKLFDMSLQLCFLLDQTPILPL